MLEPFYATGPEGTLIAADNYSETSEYYGTEVYIDVSERPDMPMDGALWVDSSATALTRDKARELRDWLTTWLGDDV